MRRFAVIAALLLPLPFAALPALSVLFSGAGTPEGVVAFAGETQVPGAAVTEAPAMQEERQDAAVAYGIDDPRDCPEASDTVIEG